MHICQRGEVIANMTTARQNQTNSSQTNFNVSTMPTPTCTQCPQIVNSTTHIVLGKLTVKGKSPCEGWLKVDLSKNDRKGLCWSTDTSKTWFRELCKELRCGDFIRYDTKPSSDGLKITSNLILNNSVCNVLHISCQDTVGKELAAYKAATGILIVFILVVIFAQFSRPTYKAMRKRFSQKRQSRWIGPTQSQSVSYHRGQGGPNNNTVKRQSYPGLERLTVSTSREPSSNRNSDYDSYGYN